MKLLITGSQTSSGGGYSTIEDEGIPLTQRTTINFVGAGVTSTDSGDKTVVTIPGGSGSSSGFTTLSFGSTPTDVGSVTVTGLSGLTTSSYIEAFVQGDSTSTNTSGDHRLLGMMGRFFCEYVSSSSIKINCDLLTFLATGDFVVHFIYS